jgi:hypothetical protein
MAFVLNIGFAQLSQHKIDKAAMHPKKSETAVIVSNNYYDLSVENSALSYNGVGTYTVRTGSSHPATIANGGVKQNVLYGGASASPWSTYLSVKSYNSNKIYYTAYDEPVPDTLCTVVQIDPWGAVTQDGPTSLLTTWNLVGSPHDSLRIEQRTYVEGATLDDSRIGVTTKVKNLGHTPKQIGIRYEWDIMIDGNDGTIMRTKNPQGPWLYNETLWTNFSYTHYEITDNPTTPTFYNLGTVTGPTYLTPVPTLPDLLTYASWGDSYGRAFNYTPTNIYLYGDDSAILYYWGKDLAHAITIAAGDSVMVTQYLFSSLMTFTYQPDNQIKNSSETSYIGDNIYNQTGVDQTKSQSVAPNNTAIYHVKIENDGNGQDGFNVREVFPTDVDWNVQYFDALSGGNNITAQVTSTGWGTGALNPGQFREIRIEVTPTPTGSQLHTYLMSTSQNDDTKRDVVQAITTALPYHDVGALQIIAPIGNIPAGTNITPKTIVQNFGNFTETFDVGFTFFGYGDTQTVTNLLPGAIDTVEFNNWTAVAGGYLETSFTMLVTDEDPSNNTAYMEFSVTGQVSHDVGVTQILAPIGAIPVGTIVTPTAIVHNFGDQPETGVPVYFNFGTYSNTQTVNLLVGQTDTVEFDNWTAVEGNYNTTAYTALTGDVNLANDTAYGEFSVYTPQIHDVGTTVILAPTGAISHGTSVTPRAKVKNFSPNSSETFYARFKIGDVYNQTVYVPSLARGEEREIEFPGWTTTGCVYVTSCSTELAIDQNTTNDKLTGIVDVIPAGREIQTNWVSGPGVSGPVPHWGLAFDESDSINYNVTGQISLIATGTGGRSDALWTKHIIETTTSIDGHNGIFPADFDGDGDLDLAGAIDGLNVIRIYRNQKVETGTVNYVTQVSLARTIGPDCLLWCGDLDNDGDADIVVPGPTVVGWYENTGNFNFTYHTIASIAHSAPCCDVGDIDNDGDNDIIVGDQPLDLYRNNGAMTFTRTNISAGVWWRVKLGDLNNDGYLDLLNSDRVYINNNGNFPSVPSWIAPLATTDGHWIRDFDNDGINDLLLADGTTNAIYWYKNNGTGSAYTQYTVCPAPNGQYYGDACIAEDIDLDGKTDVVGTYSRVGFFKQITPTSFQEIIIDSSFAGSHWCYTANLDYQPGGTDFDLDILATNSNQFAWWENPTAGLLFSNYGQLTSSVVQIPNAYTWKALNWYGNRPQNTSLLFYVRSGATDSAIQANPWQGPFEASSGQPAGSFNVTSHTTTGDHFFQYKVEMIGGGSQSPVVYEVSVDYDTMTSPVHHDVGVADVITPTDTIMTCNPFVPVIDVVNNTTPEQVEVCTVSVNIWRYQVKMDSMCHISLNPLDSVLVYSSSVVASVEPGHNNVLMDSWHPYWSDVYWVGGYHTLHASVEMGSDENQVNDSMTSSFIVIGRDHDLQMNWTGLLNGWTAVNDETLPITTYNVASAVSNSPLGPSAPFRAKVKIVRENTNSIVYSKYEDRTIAPFSYLCIAFQTGWMPSDTGWYLVRSEIEARPNVDVILENNTWEKRYYFINASEYAANNNTNPAVQGNAIPSTFGLMSNVPNPFSNRTTIRWQIPVVSNVNVSIFDATGRIVKTLVNTNYTPGYYNTTWNCTDNSNTKVAAGIYFYEMRANNFISRHKMIISY